MSMAWGNYNRKRGEGKFSAPKMRLILRTVGDYYGIKPELITENSRTEKIAKARQMSFYLARMMTDASFPQIGDFLNRDHSTVVHGFYKIVNDLQSSPELRMAEIYLMQKLMPIYNGKRSSEHEYWGA